MHCNIPFRHATLSPLTTRVHNKFRSLSLKPLNGNQSPEVETGEGLSQSDMTIKHAV